MIVLASRAFSSFDARLFCPLCGDKGGRTTRVLVTLKDVPCSVHIPVCGVPAVRADMLPFIESFIDDVIAY